MSRRERLVESNQCGSGDIVEPEISFVKLKEFEPQYNSRFKRTVFKNVYKVTHNLNDVTQNGRNVSNMLVVSKKIDDFFKDLITDGIKDASPDDFYSVSIENRQLAYPIFVPPTRVKNFDASEFLNSIYEVVMSNFEVLLDGQLSATFAVVRSSNLKGSGKKTKAPKTTFESSKKKRSVILIKNTDTLCLLRALVVSILNFSKKTNAGDWKKIRNMQLNFQKDQALKLAEDCNVPIDRPLGLNDVAKIESKLFPNYSITIVDGLHKSNRLYTGKAGAEKNLFIEFLEDSPVGHFNSIVNLTGYVDAKKFCEKCFVVSNERHICPGGCTLCLSLVKCVGDEEIQCV